MSTTTRKAATVTTTPKPAFERAGHGGSSRPELMREVLLLIGVVAAGLLARIWNPLALGINHFDEGVYVFSALGMADATQPRTLWPGQIRFSPPFYFTAVSLVYRVFGGEVDIIAVLLNVLFGTLTIAAVWLVARAWFGRSAAIAAAALTAFSQYHITYSRVALTDASFALFFVLALGAITAAVQYGSYKWAVLGGALCGLAWNTKYHGWFALLITITCLLPALRPAWRAEVSLRRAFTAWGIAATIALLMYLPWALYMRAADGGGFGGTVNYYLTMLRTDWLGNVARHAAGQYYMEGVLSRVSVPLALVAVLLVARPATLTSRRVLLLCGGVTLVALAVGSSGAALLLTLLALPALLRRFADYRVRVLLAWMGLWVLSAPVYHPYARLIIPFTLATFMVAGVGLARLIGDRPEQVKRTDPEATDDGRAVRPRVAAAFASLAAVATLLGALMLPQHGDPWHSGRGAANASTAISAIVPAAEPVHVVGEPSVSFYVHRRGHPAFRRVDMAMFDTISTAAYLVTGVYTVRAPELRQAVEGLADRLTHLASFDLDPTDLRLLDDHPPGRARQYRAAPDRTFDLQLYRVAPP